MHRTKGDYIATHVIFSHKVTEIFFSLINFDESIVLDKSRLEINVSYLESCQVRKQNFSTVSLEGGKSAQELSKCCNR